MTASSILFALSFFACTDGDSGDGSSDDTGETGLVDTGPEPTADCTYDDIDVDTTVWTGGDEVVITFTCADSDLATSSRLTVGEQTVDAFKLAPVQEGALEASFELPSSRDVGPYDFTTTVNEEDAGGDEIRYHMDSTGIDDFRVEQRTDYEQLSMDVAPRPTISLVAHDDAVIHVMGDEGGLSFSDCTPEVSGEICTDLVEADTADIALDDRVIERDGIRAALSSGNISSSFIDADGVRTTIVVVVTHNGKGVLRDFLASKKQKGIDDGGLAITSVNTIGDFPDVVVPDEDTVDAAALVPLAGRINGGDAGLESFERVFTGTSTKDGSAVLAHATNKGGVWTRNWQSSLASVMGGAPGEWTVLGTSDIFTNADGKGVFLVHSGSAEKGLFTLVEVESGSVYASADTTLVDTGSPMVRFALTEEGVAISHIGDDGVTIGLVNPKDLTLTSQQLAVGEGLTADSHQVELRNSEEGLWVTWAQRSGNQTLMAAHFARPTDGTLDLKADPDSVGVVSFGADTALSGTPGSAVDKMVVYTGSYYSHRSSVELTTKLLDEGEVALGSPRSGALDGWRLISRAAQVYAVAPDGVEQEKPLPIDPGSIGGMGVIDGNLVVAGTLLIEDEKGGITRQGGLVTVAKNGGGTGTTKLKTLGPDIRAEVTDMKNEGMRVITTTNEGATSTVSIGLIDRTSLAGPGEANEIDESAFSDFAVAGSPGGGGLDLVSFETGGLGSPQASYAGIIRESAMVGGGTGTPDTIAVLPYDTDIGCPYALTYIPGGNALDADNVKQAVAIFTSEDPECGDLPEIVGVADLDGNGDTTVILSEATDGADPMGDRRVFAVGIVEGDLVEGWGVTVPHYGWAGVADLDGDGLDDLLMNVEGDGLGGAVFASDGLWFCESEELVLTTEDIVAPVDSAYGEWSSQGIRGFSAGTQWGGARLTGGGDYKSGGAWVKRPTDLHTHSGMLAAVAP